MEAPAEIAPQVDADLGVDNSHGYWEDVTVSDVFYCKVAVNDASYQNIYYMPIEFQNALLDKSKYTDLSDALFYIDKAINWSITDVRPQAELKLTATASTPLNLHDIGMRVFDMEGDMTQTDRLYPYSQTADYNVFKTLRTSSRTCKHAPVPPMRGGLMENLFMVKQSGNWKQYRDEVDIRTARFHAKNNVVEAPLFSGGWVNDIGFHKRTKHLFNDIAKEVSVPMMGVGATAGTSGQYKPFLQTPLYSKYDVMHGTRMDYMSGWTNMPRYALEDQMQDWGGSFDWVPGQPSFMRAKASSVLSEVGWQPTTTNVRTKEDSNFGTYILPEERKTVNPISYRTKGEQVMLTQNGLLMASVASQKERTATGYLPKIAENNQAFILLL